MFCFLPLDFYILTYPFWLFAIWLLSFLTYCNWLSGIWLLSLLTFGAWLLSILTFCFWLLTFWLLSFLTFCHLTFITFDILHLTFYFWLLSFWLSTFDLFHFWLFASLTFCCFDFSLSTYCRFDFYPFWLLASWLLSFLTSCIWLFAFDFLSFDLISFDFLSGHQLGDRRSASIESGITVYLRYWPTQWCIININSICITLYKLAMKIWHYYPHSSGILGCHANVDFQHTNYLLNVAICEKLRCAHKLQTISDAFSHIASRFVKVALAIKFALNWLAGPQCSGCNLHPGSKSS